MSQSRRKPKYTDKMRDFLEQKKAQDQKNQDAPRGNSGFGRFADSKEGVVAIVKTVSSTPTSTVTPGTPKKNAAFAVPETPKKSRDTAASTAASAPQTPLSGGKTTLPGTPQKPATPASASATTPKKLTDTLSNSSQTNGVSPGEALRNMFRARADYISASKVNSLTDTEVQTNTPQGRKFVKLFPINFQKSEGGVTHHVEVQLYQSVASQTPDTTVSVASPPRLQRIAKQLELPKSDAYTLTREVNKDDLATGARTYSHTVPAKNIIAALLPTQKPVLADHSHVFQHGLIPSVSAQAELTPEQKQAGVTPDTFVSFPAPKNHNSNRLIGPENSIIRDAIRQSPLTYTNHIQLFPNTPVVKREVVTWQKKNADGTQNNLQFTFDPWKNDVAPAKQLSGFIRDTVRHVYNLPSTTDQAVKKPKRKISEVSDVDDASSTMSYVKKA